MTRTFLSWRWLCAVLALTLTATAWADEDGSRGKGKGKGPKPETVKDTIIQLDTSKLPPDLLKQLMKYTAESQKKKGKPKMATKGKGKLTLPPGLARKAVDHPGRVNWLREHGYMEPTKGKVKKGKDKKGGDD